MNKKTQQNKIGIFFCTILVCSSILGSGIAMLPSTLASIGSISIFCWGIAICGGLSLGLVFAKLAMQEAEVGGPVAYAQKLSPIIGHQTGITYYYANWIGNLAIGISGISYLAYFFPILKQPIPSGFAVIGAIWLLTLVNLRGVLWVSRLASFGVGLLLLAVLATATIGWLHFNPQIYLQNWNVSHTPPP